MNNAEEEKGGPTGVALDIKDVREMWLTKKESMQEEDGEGSSSGNGP